MKPLRTLFIALSLVSSLSASSQPFPKYVPARGLAAWYAFTGNSLDSSGNGNNATRFSTTLTTDRFGRANSAYNFSGSGSYMTIPANAASTLNIRNGSFTISAWYKMASLSNPSEMQLFWRGDAQFATDIYALSFTSGLPTLRRDVNTGTTLNTVNYSLFTPDTSKFHHLAGVYDSSASLMSIYLDGLLVGQATRSGNAMYNTNNFFNVIGAAENGNIQNFNGKLDDIGVWNRALSYCEISRLFYGDTSLIARQPVAATAVVGSAATFSIADVSSNATYQWQIDSTGTGYISLTNTPPYSGVDTKTLTISGVSAHMNGDYYRCIRSGGGCTEISAEQRLTISTTAVRTFGKANSLSVYPNPNAGRFTIANKDFQGNLIVEIGDVTGRRLVVQTYQSGTGSIDVDLAGKLVPGTYILKLHTQDDVYATQIVIR